MKYEPKDTSKAREKCNNTLTFFWVNLQMFNFNPNIHNLKDNTEKQMVAKLYCKNYYKEN